MRIYELYPQYDNAQSFYNKAKICECENEKILMSYDVEICKEDSNGNISFCADVMASQTTLRHVKEYLLQKFGASFIEDLLSVHKKQAKNFKQLYIFLQGKTLKENYVIE